jgi:hypothetical protein
MVGTAENCFVFIGGKNWTLIQRRRSITKNPWGEAKWNDYKIGFGNPSAENFWLGLEKMHDMTVKGKRAFSEKKPLGQYLLKNSWSEVTDVFTNKP